MTVRTGGTLITPAITLGTTNLATILGEKANTNNPSFTGNVGINVTTSDSALHIVGTKLDNPTTVGIRMGKSSNFASPGTNSYGIELCSDTDTQGGSYIDFTYPFGSNPTYYAGRMFFENNSAYFGWNANYIPASSEALAQPFQMTLNRYGDLTVQSKINVPSISLNGLDLTTALQSKAELTNPSFIQNLP